MKRFLALFVGVVIGALAQGTGCYRAPELDGPFRCVSDESCGGDGFVCDDGVCCRPTGDPMCLSLVLDGGVCADGGAPQRYFHDRDQDGYGNEAEPIFFCAKPVLQDVTAVGGDCVDTPGIGEGIHPGAAETCDGIDNDCDGEIDEGFTLREFFFDFDGDGYGDPDAGVFACSAPPQHVNNSSDCAPEDLSVHPGATEVCNYKNDDCDSETDEGFANPSILDVCNGIDDDCLAPTDARPDCGGPLRLAVQPAPANVSYGARRVDVDPGTAAGASGGCWNTFSGVAQTFSGGTWSGSGAGAHVAWVKSSREWDLSTPGATLQVRMNISTTNNERDGGTFHPAVLLCNKRGEYLRIRSNSRVLPTSVSSDLVLDRTNSGWTAVAHFPDGGSTTPPSAAIVHGILQDTVSVELYLKTQTSGGTPSFSVTFPQAFGFK